MSLFNPYFSAIDLENKTSTVELKKMNKQNYDPPDVSKNKLRGIITNLKNEIGVPQDEIDLSWKEYQLKHTQYNWTVFNVREIFINWLCKHIVMKLRKIKPEFVFDIKLNNFGSKNVTSDIDVNTMVVVSLEQEIDYQEYFSFLKTLVDIFVKEMKSASRLWNTKYDYRDVLSRSLDINFYPPGPFFETVTSNVYEGIGTSSTNTCCFLPIFRGKKTLIQHFLNNEISKSIESNGKIIMPDEVDLELYYRAYKKHVNKGLTCYLDTKGGVANCLSKLFSEIFNEKKNIKEWNSLLCCLVGTNKYGSELYFTMSSIIFVVFYMQIKGSVPDDVLKIIAIPAYVEQMCFYYMHGRNEKYWKRAMKAKEMIDKKYMGYVKSTYLETIKRLEKMY